LSGTISTQNNAINVGSGTVTVAYINSLSGTISTQNNAINAGSGAVTFGTINTGTFGVTAGTITTQNNAINIGSGNLTAGSINIFGNNYANAGILARSSLLFNSSNMPKDAAGGSTLYSPNITLASQSIATSNAWRIIAHGTYAASTNTNVRSLGIQCYWGTTALSPRINTANVLLSSTQTTGWVAQYTLLATTPNTLGVTGYLSHGVSATPTSSCNLVGPFTNNTSLSSPNSIDFKIGQNGTYVANDTITVQSVFIERLT
jgi:hypothetical protein